jgi:hypothetical protein
MKLIIEMDLDSAAFDDQVEEVRRILEELCERIPDPLDVTDGPINLYDANGNRCGDARIVNPIKGKPRGKC